MTCRLRIPLTGSLGRGVATFESVPAQYRAPASKPLRESIRPANCTTQSVSLVFETITPATGIFALSSMSIRRTALVAAMKTRSWISSAAVQFAANIFDGKPSAGFAIEINSIRSSISVIAISD